MIDHLGRTRQICLSLPEAVEQEAWGEPTFRVRKKLFAMYASPENHHGRGRHSLWCNAPLGVQELLVRSEPARYFVPPYVGCQVSPRTELLLVCFPDELRATWNGRPGTEP